MPSPPLTPLATAVLHIGRAPERILEVSCGSGDGVMFLAREYPGARVRGVDGDEENVRAASARIGLDPEGRVAFKRGKGRALPYPEDFFDLAVQRHGVLVPTEISRVLRRGGHLIYVAGRPRWWWLPRARPARLPAILRRAGFEPVATGEADGGAFYVGRLNGD